MQKANTSNYVDENRKLRLYSWLQRYVLVLTFYIIRFNRDEKIFLAAKSTVFKLCGVCVCVHTYVHAVVGAVIFSGWTFSIVLEIYEHFFRICLYSIKLQAQSVTNWIIMKFFRSRKQLKYKVVFICKDAQFC